MRSPRLPGPPLLVLGLLPLLAVSTSPRPASFPGAPPGAQDEAEELERAWKKLTDGQKREVAEWLRAETRYIETFQGTLLRHALGLNERDPTAWPEAAEAPVYDPEVHAPAQPIRRKRLSERSGRAKSWREKVFAKRAKPTLERGFVYDHASGEVVRLGRYDDPERVFRNAVAGYPPDLDLAEALVERFLDDGSLRRSYVAFSHGYADRDGRVYPGVTLYDAWASGQEIEMPDVECLGLVHDLLDDWKTWKAPVPESQHDAMYDRIGELFLDVHRHRGVRQAFARTYLRSSPDLELTWLPHLERLHALWDLHSSNLGPLSESLPEPEDLAEWMEKQGERVDTDKELWANGTRRRATLARNEAQIRTILVGILRQMGVMGD